VNTKILLDTWESRYGLFIGCSQFHSMSGFVISWHTTLEIHKNYNFNQKIIIPRGFDTPQKCAPEKKVPLFELAPRSNSDC